MPLPSGTRVGPYEVTALIAQDWSRDGRYLLYSEENPQTGVDLWALELAAAPKATAVLRSAFQETRGRFSPDARWLAYTSNESGRAEVFVQAFPPSGGKWQVSTQGGDFPVWRSDGRELFFRTVSGLMAAQIRAVGDRIDVGQVRQLFSQTSDRIAFQDINAPYDVTADGSRFLVLTPAPLDDRTPITVLANWQATLSANGR